jgi:hypothetical protein
MRERAKESLLGIAFRFAVLALVEIRSTTRMPNLEKRKFVGVSLVKGCAGAPHATYILLGVAMGVSCARWVGTTIGKVEFRNGTVRGIPPPFFAKSAQRVWNQGVGNIPILGVGKVFGLWELRRGSARGDWAT